MHVWIARGIALLALLAAAGGVLYVLSSVESTDELTVEETQDHMTRLNAANARLSGLLEALEPGASPAEAQAAVREAADLTRELLDDTPAEGSLSDRMRGTLGAELDYLDALGSTLNNPRSALRATIGPKQIVLREQVKSTPGGDVEVISGGAELVAFSKSRTGEL